MISGVLYIKNFLSTPEKVFQYLNKEINWDQRMRSRKTASFGVAYNYSQIEYPKLPIPKIIEDINVSIDGLLNFKPNNCLINFYENGTSKMGFHSDQIDILAKNTGVVIISLGAERVLRFRNIENKENVIDYSLANGSLIYMDQLTQKEWQHSIPKDDTKDSRMSLTFRNIVNIMN